MKFQHHVSGRKGVSLVYTSFAIFVVSGFMSFALDLGRVRTAKAELQTAADAAARAAAQKLNVSTTAAATAATAVAAENKVEGATVALAASDIETGLWNAATQTFTLSATNANAVRITAKRTSARGNPISLVFGQLIGRPTIDLTASAIAAMNPTVVTANTTVDGKANPFAAAMDDTWLYDPWGGEMVSAVSAAQSSIPVVPGQQLTFAATGTVSWQHWQGPGSYTGPDGAGWVQSNMYPENHPGNADIVAPGMSLIGMFATDGAASGTKPATLDFSTAASQNYTQLTPLTNQPFFIGDGLTSTGVTQTVTVPPGATRLFFGVNDSVAWRDNAGYLSVTTTIRQVVLTVR
jgi:Flp pilus assembly protein TadG